MVAQTTFPCCKHGHPWTEYTAMWCQGRRRCRICHNQRTCADITRRYRADPEFRKKRCAASNARHQRRRNQANDSSNVPSGVS